MFAVLSQGNLRRETELGLQGCSGIFFSNSVGGNLFMCLGVAHVLESMRGVVITALGLIPTDFMVRRYAFRVSRWF